MDNIRELLIWSGKFEFSLDALPDIEWICDADFSMAKADPKIIANILLLFGNS